MTDQSLQVRPSLLERARFNPPPTPLESALLDEGIRLGTAPCDLVIRAYGFTDNQLRIRTMPHGR